MAASSWQPQEDEIVRVDDLWFRYPAATKPALSGVSLSVRRGEFVGIIGPSGAGKSTLCQIVKGIIPHSSPGELEGRATVFGADVTNLEEFVLVTARIGLVLQDPEAQIIGMTVAEDLAYGPENYEIAPEEIRERSRRCLTQVGLGWDLMERDTYALSGGEKQRLAVASALMLEPELLILDEPTSELDPLGKQQIFAVLESLREQGGVTILIVEHEVERLVRVADRIVVIESGKVLAAGQPLDVFTGEGVQNRTAGERLPAAAALLQELAAAPTRFPPLRPTLDLETALNQVAAQLDRKL